MNRLFRPAKLSALSLLSILMSLASAVPVTALSSATSAGGNSPFCTNLSTNSVTITKNVASLVDKLTTARSGQDTRVTDRRSAWDQELIANRAKWDATRQQNFTVLESKATTDAQKQAVKIYEASLLQGIATRRAANDGARGTFRSGVDALRDARRKAVDFQVSAFSSTVQDAIGTATASCANDSSTKNGVTVHETYAASLKAARSTFVAARAGDNKIATDVAELATARDASIKADDTAFEARAKTVLEAFRTSFGPSSSI